MPYLKLWEKFWVSDLWSKGAVQGDIDVDRDKCTGCGLCVKACPGDSLRMDEDKKPAPKDGGELNCASCGACQAICPVEAVTVVRKTEFIGLFKTLRRGPLSKPRLFDDLRD